VKKKERRGGKKDIRMSAWEKEKKCSEKRKSQKPVRKEKRGSKTINQLGLKARES